MKKFLARWLPVLLWAGLIYLGSGISTPKAYLPAWLLRWTDQVIFGEYRLTRILGLVTHFVEFLILFLLLARALNREGKLAFWPTLAAIDLALVYAVFDEIHQTQIPGRLFELSDLAVDGAGIALGLVVYLLWQALGFMDRERRSQPE